MLQLVNKTMVLDEIMTQGQIASALLFIAVVLTYYVFVVKDRERPARKKN